jgi:hypothetical protein
MAAAAQCVTSLAWTDQRPPRVRDLCTEWRSEEGGLRWLRTNQQLRTSGLHTLELDLQVKELSSSCSSSRQTERLHGPIISAAVRLLSLNVIIRNQSDGPEGPVRWHAGH